MTQDRLNFLTIKALPAHSDNCYQGCHCTIMPFACIVTTSTEYHSPLVVVGVGTLQGAPTVQA